MLNYVALLPGSYLHVVKDRPRRSRGLAIGCLILGLRLLLSSRIFRLSVCRISRHTARISRLTLACSGTPPALLFRLLPSSAYRHSCEPSSILSWSHPIRGIPVAFSPDHVVVLPQVQLSQ